MTPLSFFRFSNRHLAISPDFGAASIPLAAFDSQLAFKFATL
jgi:hypothetical protein